MMACTDRHDRFLMRLLTKHALLYTEMVTTPALIYGKREELLAFNQAEHPLALQLGGNDPQTMAQCASMAEDLGFDEVNINVGCPSDRVKAGCFGAALMAEPATVAKCVEKMRAAVAIPVTVKTRIGIDDLDSYAHLTNFITTVANAGCETFIIHARKAWLTGLSPRENREIPPLRYDIAAQLVADFPALEFVLNGGLNQLEDAAGHIKVFAGVMLGRAPYANPFMLAGVDEMFFDGPPASLTREQVLATYCDYVDDQLRAGVDLRHMSRHLVGLFQGQPGARRWRRYLSDHQWRSGADTQVLMRALGVMHEARNDAQAQSTVWALEKPA
ncbi:MAG: tRNA-dihydrouridine synthase A [Gammaproteobacteria bacterium]|jgi:tRNA-dihydrouridine synthase A